MDEAPHGGNLRKGRVSIPGQTYLVTAVTRGRSKVFTNFDHARTLILTMQRSEREGRVESLAFVIMPDHLHWLFRLQAGTLAELMKQVKGRSAAGTGIPGGIWQKGYHDHALRWDEDLVRVAGYLVANPVRAGLVRNVMDYPHWDGIWFVAENRE
ncbi:transposase [Geothermobacter hydrogeniphilus]|uniref:Transposase n=1 Tax=Geothermobacter hydrogeniphilus TaxID=1969733 RepID=A0A2K2H5F6_9BACT|nr:transposase [Geothermobacter hydrogeniphilus]PNU18566.1 transposase [Geothermobacter hydrogeniphilus]